jgi:hypothetical protein
MRTRLALLTLAGFIVGLFAGGAIGVYLAQATASGTYTTPAIYLAPHPKTPLSAQGKIALGATFSWRAPA